MSDTVLLVGCGNMGRAMLEGWLAANPSLKAYVVEPADSLRDRASALGATVAASVGELPDGVSPDLIFLAVKPQIMPSVLPDYAGFTRATFVSIAAGTTVTTLRGGLGADAAVIRCMPNTPAAIGAGMMVCCANEHASDTAKSLSSKLLASSGLVEWIEDEALMDAVTALSGSGPAYVFHLIETMGKAGAELGLPADLAARMAMQTVMGAGKLASEVDTPPGTLREQVTSPGGTTAAALNVLMQGLQPLVTEAITAARDRGVELGKG